MTHASASFLLFNKLAPLGKDVTSLALVKYDDVKPVVGENPYVKSEEQLIAEYNSTTTIPQLVFLGLDERKADDGLRWKTHAGAPVFALDVTPRGTLVEKAEALMAEMVHRGYAFLEGRHHTSLCAPEGP